ncbi:MAG: type IV pilus twitching motility protein PilT [Planctomycetota bacterium]
MDQNSFGQILLNLNLISEKQLAYALALQKRGQARPLGELLIEQKLIDEKTVNSILSIQTRRMKVDRTTLNQNEQEFRVRMRDVDLMTYLKFGRDARATHLHLGSNEVPNLRVHGSLKEIKVDPLAPDRMKALCYSLLTAEQREEFEKCKSIDLCLERPDVGRFRFNLFQHTAGLSAVVRYIESEIRDFESLQLPPIVRDLAGKSSGLLLITGPGMSGKTTTLAALVDHINRNFKRHVITLENPVEVVHRSRKSKVSHRQIGMHSNSFASALRSALREDPDVLVVSEMRDPETIATAITAAETGHLVIGTLHTRNSYRTIIRILDQFPANKRASVRTILAGVLRGVICQDLVPNLNGDALSLAYEVLVVNNAIANLIREDRIWQVPMAMQIGSADGMCLMDDTLLRLVRAGTISLEEALVRATEREKFLNVDGLFMPSPVATAESTTNSRPSGASAPRGAQRSPVRTAPGPRTNTASPTGEKN